MLKLCVTTETVKELNITPSFGQNTEKNWLQHIHRISRNRLPGILKKATDQQAKDTRRDQSRDFWICETGPVQQLAQLHVS